MYSSSIQSTLLHKCTWKLKYISNIPKSNTFEGAGGCKWVHLQSRGCSTGDRGCKGGAPPKARGAGGAAPVSEGAPLSYTTPLVFCEFRKTNLPENLKLRHLLDFWNFSIWHPGSPFSIYSYPGLSENISHVLCSIQRLHRIQIIWVCSDIWVFSVLDNRHLSDIWVICQKCQFEERKGWKALFLQSQEMHCKQADSAILKLLLFGFISNTSVM